MNKGRSDWRLRMARRMKDGTLGAIIRGKALWKRDNV